MLDSEFRNKVEIVSDVTWNIRPYDVVCATGFTVLLFFVVVTE